ncbi:DgyrCDS11314 [Dimorphilus gyrociliatus]|uniref:DgyrCDS11314 n=1 Tax=Dimorphilus gyrociliatus TaxID=2664684 RepID=A0A7I8W485_9ANNE|nr:DgyrCDS11314 [Dimorphilus gyrociliatus]
MMKISKLILLVPAIVLLSQVQSIPTGERCEECTVQDCLYGIHPDAETPGICDCRCKDCSDHCENCKYGVLNLKSDGCPDCSSCCDNPCDRNPCSGHKSVCVVNKYPNPFQVICRYGYTCVEPEHPTFDCKEMKCNEDETCVESVQKNAPAKCEKTCKPLECDIACTTGFKKDRAGCDTCACCPPVTCRMFCLNGFAKGSNGCEECKCNGPPPPLPPQPPTSCAAVTCQQGTVCKVLPEPNCFPHSPCRMIAQCVKQECPPVCAIFCEHGNVMDKNGCPTCTCNPSPVPKCSKNSDCLENQVCDEETKTCGCSKIMCTLFCEDGFEQLNGCPICKCRKSESCLDKRCGPGETCIEDDIQCVTAPCYKNPRCVKSETCSKNSDCPKNQVCDEETKTCGCAKYMCEMFCENGFEQLNGCPICKCREPTSCRDKKCGTGEVCIEDDIECVTAPCYKNPRCELATCERCRPNEECKVETVVCKKAPCKQFLKCVPNDLCKKCKEGESCEIATSICIPGFVCKKPIARCVPKNKCQYKKCNIGEYCKEKVHPCLVPPCPTSAVCVKQQTTCAAMLCRVGHFCVEENGEARCVLDPVCVKANCRKDQNCMIITRGCLANGECPGPIGECHDIKPPKNSCDDIKCELGEICEEKVHPCLVPPCPTDAVCVKPKTTCAAMLCQVGHFCVEENGEARCILHRACKEANCKNNQDCILSKVCDNGGICHEIGKCVNRAICEPVRCKMYCEFGWKRDSKSGCEICKCADSCEDATCPRDKFCVESNSQVKCENCPVFRCMACPIGQEYIRDERGCKTCQCKVTCPVIRCAVFCPNGYKKDKNGCNTCECEEPKTCKDIKCRDNEYCEMSITCMAIGCPPSRPMCRSCPMIKCVPCKRGEVNVINEHGCKTCQCKPICPQVDCVTRCSTGYATDENGCTTCTCNGPEPKTCDFLNCPKDTFCEMSVTCLGPNCPPSTPICERCPVYRCPPCSEKEINVLDERGCKTCECKPNDCPIVDCDEIICKNGMKVDENGCQTCTCKPPPPQPTCDNFSCPVPGTQCEMIPTPCAPPPAFCNEKPCVYYCHPVPVCKKVNTFTCANILCPVGQICEMQKVECVKEPCHPVPVCVVNPLCKKANCRKDQECRISYPKCKSESTKCNGEPVAECIAKDPCSLIDCLPNQICDNGKCMCARHPPCRMFCQYGYELDKNGCKICKCLEAPKCKPLACRMACPHGLVRDKNGCDICECAPSPKCQTVKCGRYTECKDGKCVCKPVLCKLYCEHGWAKDERTGCDKCACAPSPKCQTVKCDRYTECKDGKCVCKPVLCKLYCEHGWAKDERTGCDKCACAPSPKCQTVKCDKYTECKDGKCVCKPVMCRRYCEHGWAKDERTGCEKCECAPAPKCDTVRCGKYTECKDGKCVCKPVMCRRYCEHGWAKDERTGCDKCECAPAPKCDTVRCGRYTECKDGKCVCKPVLCDMFCNHGWAKDEETGCDICKCNPPPINCALPKCDSTCSNTKMVKDEFGCMKCLCMGNSAVESVSRNNCVESSCGNLRCDTWGFAVDTNGCKICDCARPKVRDCPNSLCNRGEKCQQEEVCNTKTSVCKTKRFCVFNAGMISSKREIE